MHVLLSDALVCLYQTCNSDFQNLWKVLLMCVTSVLFHTVMTVCRCLTGGSLNDGYMCVHSLWMAWVGLTPPSPHPSPVLTVQFCDAQLSVCKVHDHNNQHKVSSEVISTLTPFWFTRCITVTLGIKCPSEWNDTIFGGVRWLFILFAVTLYCYRVYIFIE